MKLFTVTKTFIMVVKNRKQVPMRLFWLWLGYKWLEDLCKVIIPILNPHLVIMGIITLVLYVIGQSLIKTSDFIINLMDIDSIGFKPDILNYVRYKQKRIKVSKEYLKLKEKDS